MQPPCELIGAYRENGGGGLFGSLRQIPNQAGEIAIVRIESGQQLCVLQRFGKTRASRL